MNPNERMLKLLQATPEQLAVIDRALSGQPEIVERTGPLLMQVREAAKLLGVHRATIWRLVRAGRLRTVPLLGSERVLREDVEAVAFASGPRGGASKTRDGGAA